MIQTPQTPAQFPRDPLASGPGDEVRVVGRGQRWVVVDKPYGLLSVPGRGEDKADCVQARVQAMFPDATGPVSVHRLDMETSGLMVFALSKPAHARLSRQFETRSVGKGYTALLAGKVEGDGGEVDLPLLVDWPNRPRQQVDFERGKPAQTPWRVVARELGGTRVEFRPRTGRTHQLRIHAATPREEGGLGAPMQGDLLNGAPATAPRLLLHASHLSLWGPYLGEWGAFDSAAPF